MIINTLQLRNFRNYKALDISLSDKLNIIIGDNAQGKTNILESIYVLAITKSLTCNDEKNLIKFEEDFLKIKGDVSLKDKKVKLEVIISKQHKKVKINNKEITRLGEYISNLNIVFFGPSDLRLLKDSPSVRRKFLNIEISQLSGDYLNILNEYNYVLKCRNEFLKNANINKKYDKLYLDIINEKFVNLCISIMKKRHEFICKINEKIGTIFEKIMGVPHLSVNYLSSINYKDDVEELKGDILHKLEENISREIVYKNTIIGVHRDDFNIELDGNDIAIYGSQGQKRVAILAFKLSELDIFNEVTGTYPILLLDDIFSELDNDKCNKLVDFITSDIQTIITSTDINVINKDLVENAKIFKITRGSLEEDNYGK